MHEQCLETAAVREIAVHWQVTSETARKHLMASGVLPVSREPMRFRWRDVWALEGSGYVRPDDWSEWKVPLLNINDLLAHFPHLKERALRTRAQNGKLPAIKIGKEWRFRECEIREAAVYG